MNCQSFETIIDDLAREQLLDAHLRDTGLRHAEACSSCGLRLDEARDLTSKLRALALEMNSWEASPALEGLLLTRFAEQQTARQAQHSSRWNSWRVAAAAAVLLVGFGIAVVAWNSRTSNSSVAIKSTSSTGIVSGGGSIIAQATATPGVKETTPASENIPNIKGKIKAQRKAIARPQSINTQTTALSGTERTTDFVPIGYINSTSLQDGGSVVRVELPRATIMSLGFAMNMDRYGERVKADLLMGADGSARAIRFVE